MKTKKKVKKVFKCPDGLDCSTCSGCFYRLLCFPEFRKEIDDIKKSFESVED